MPTKEQRIQTKRDQIRKLDERIGALMSQRADLEEELADLLPKSNGTFNPVVAHGGQPFTGSQRVILEKRTPEGMLDRSEPQAPSGSMTFDELYQAFFRNEPTMEGTWANLRAWLESKHWVVRAKTW
jgi:hypothetical protein